MTFGGLDSILTFTQRMVGILQPSPSATLHVGGDIRLDGNAYRYNAGAGAWEPLQAPTGSLSMYAGAAAPLGWLLCDGAAVSRTTYANLFTAIGTAWGTGNGTTTFNLPDLRGRVPVGVSASHALASAGGEESHTLTAAEMPVHGHTASQPTHTHSITDPQHNHTVDPSGRNYDLKISGAGGTNQYQTASNQAQVAGNVNLGVTQYAGTGINGTNAGGNDAVTVNTSGSGSAHNVMQPFVSVNYIIKS